MTRLTVQDVQAALGQLGSHGPAGRTAQVRETHISWVFLTDDRAFKLKKPLVLPFLDYSTPERRRDMCREEVALNRRLAPDLYLRVVALADHDGRLALAGEDDPRAVDYMVEMRRYDERHTMTSRLERGELTSGEVGEVARLLARFHAQARGVEPKGVPALAIERRLTQDFHELLAVVEQRAEIERVMALERFMHAFISSRAEQLDRRARSGLVREVHGDLRAEHVLLGPPIAITDCIEFDPALRELDVADDLAFMVMDLTAQGADALARELVRTYREAGGDCGDEQLVAFYAVHRALVRAKVAMLRATQLPPASTERGHKSAVARDLLGLADRFAWRARMPRVIAVCGLPAVGKSYLARALAGVSGLSHLSSDLTRKRLAGVRATKPAPASAYQSEFNRLTYAELGRRAAAETMSRGGAIVDATCRRRADRDAFLASLEEAAPVLFVECRAPVSVIRQRARKRARSRSREGDVSDASPAVVERELSSWEPLDEIAPADHLTLRSDRPVETQLADVTAWLDRRV
jgi:aminoglycoside phosphotransferase family enzyme/predicted kinase